MKPRPTTLETRRIECRKWCAEKVANPPPDWLPIVMERLRAVVNLPQTATPREIVDAQMRVASWEPNMKLTITCSACLDHVERAVEVGEEPGEESATATLCRACLVEALAALDVAP